MASHRKPRTHVLTTPGSRRTAVGLTTVALASVGLLSQAAQAAPSEPRQSIEEVQKKVDQLYRQAGTATQQYNQAKERTERQRTAVDRLLDDVANRTEKLNEARRTLGNYAAAQYRNGGMAPTATMLLADSPQDYFARNHLLDRMTDRQRQAVEQYQGEQESASKQRSEATRSLASLTEAQQELRDSKQSVQDKLGQARELLSELTAEEKARLAELERKREAEAQRKAEELARQQAEKARQEAAEKAAAEEAAAQESPSQSSDSASGSGSGSSSGSSSDAYAAKAEKAIAFARAQIGKPYVWGATGPSSFDCSGLTQAAWKAAGVSLPRTTWDQVEVGTRVATEDLKPGDLVFFYDDISHVGLYIGDGQMIHAPKPGANVRTEAITYMPIYGSVRPS
ncbi:NlpC/P60 family protein [Streptomyces pathocidini]|uniref:C40 family peptidase n=1 Tax=Streptomyces pathocidini TaxID=1650571 RepID=UPI0033F02BDE